MRWRRPPWRHFRRILELGPLQDVGKYIKSLGASVKRPAALVVQGNPERPPYEPDPNVFIWNLTPLAFYVHPEGDDSNDGLTPETPFKSAERVMQLGLLPGDQVLFFRGGTWDSFYLEFRYSGTRFQPILIGTYGDGGHAELKGTERLDPDTWEQGDGTNFQYWRHPRTTINGTSIPWETYVAFENGVMCQWHNRYPFDLPDEHLGQGQFIVRTGGSADGFYLRPWSSDPSKVVVEVGVKPRVIMLNGCRWVRLEHLWCRGSNLDDDEIQPSRAAVAIVNCQHVHLKDVVASEANCFGISLYNSQHVTLEDCRVFLATARGINITTGCKHVTVRRCVVHDLGPTARLTEDGEGNIEALADLEGIAITVAEGGTKGPYDDILIEDCEIYRCGSDYSSPAGKGKGICAWAGHNTANSIRIVRTKIHNCWGRGISLESVDGCCFELDHCIITECGITPIDREGTYVGALRMQRCRGSTLRLRHCTIWANSGNGPNSYGSIYVYLDEDEPPEIKTRLELWNCVVGNLIRRGTGPVANVIIACYGGTFEYAGDGNVFWQEDTSEVPLFKDLKTWEEYSLPDWKSKWGCDSKSSQFSPYFRVSDTIATDYTTTHFSVLEPIATVYAVPQGMPLSVPSLDLKGCAPVVMQPYPGAIQPRPELRPLHGQMLVTSEGETYELPWVTDFWYISGDGNCEIHLPKDAPFLSRMTLFNKADNPITVVSGPSWTINQGEKGEFLKGPAWWEKIN